MSYLSDAPGTRLSTTWETILYVDTASGELRHGPISGNSNAVFIADQGSSAQVRSGRLMHRVGEELEPIVCMAENSWAASSATLANGSYPSTEFQVTCLDGGLICLKSGEYYLCAEASGQITLSRTTCSTWESFMLSDAPITTVASQDEGKSVQLSVPVVGTRSSTVLRRVLVVHHRGNLANRMLQYMGALTIASRIKDCTIVNVSIPEWGIEIPDDTEGQRFFDNVDLWSWDPFRPQVHELTIMANRSESIRIIMADHLQRMEFLLDRPFYNRIFPKNTVRSEFTPTANDLVINIRANEILNGVPHYPILPIAFYEDIIATTGLNPVFVGQLNPSEYMRQIRLRFPQAIFIESGGARSDFDLIRSAKNIVVAVSTFSWLAAWLSDAQNIFLPLSGFYNPAHHREIDLLPVDDVRYRFFLFPLHYGLPERESLAYHERMKHRWKEISRNQVALLKSSAPFLRVPRENYDGGLPTRSARGAQITFDSSWYAHEYIDAAMEISEGWFEDPLHHYLEIGRLRGYLPTRPVAGASPIDLMLANLSLNKRATQSSTCRWSRGSTVEEDASNAVNGNPWEEYAFHTDEEQNPWWLVDLAAVSYVYSMRIFNRDHIPEAIQRRASPLVVEISNDGDQWQPLFRTEPGQIFGGYSNGRPLVWSSPQPIKARLVRITIPRREILHLAEVEIYGRPIGATTSCC